MGCLNVIFARKKEQESRVYYRRDNKASTMANRLRTVENIPLKNKDIKKLQENWIEINHKMIVAGRGIFIRCRSHFLSYVATANRMSKIF